MRIDRCASYTLSLTNPTNKVSYAAVYCLQPVYSFLYVYVRLAIIFLSSLSIKVAIYTYI